jgi:hypothetical protein
MLACLLWRKTFHGQKQLISCTDIGLTVLEDPELCWSRSVCSIVYPVFPLSSTYSVSCPCVEFFFVVGHVSEPMSFCFILYHPFHVVRNHLESYYCLPCAVALSYDTCLLSSKYWLFLYVDVHL